MTISQQNTLKRWEYMASKDLGYMINDITNEMVDLLRKVFNGSTQFNCMGNFSAIKPLLLAFKCQDEFIENTIITECLDVDMITTTSDDLLEFDKYLMDKKDFFIRYQYAQTI